MVCDDGLPDGEFRLQSSTITEGSLNDPMSFSRSTRHLHSQVSHSRVHGEDWSSRRELSLSRQELSWSSLTARGFGRLDRLSKRIKSNTISSNNQTTFKSKPQHLRSQRQARRAARTFKLCSRDRKLDCEASVVEGEPCRINYDFDTFLAQKSI